MIARPFAFLLTGAALSCAALSTAAADNTPSSATCSKPPYPKAALQGEEEGVSVVGFLIRADGTVARSMVLNSSGSPDLDQATRDGLAKCVFVVAHLEGKPVEAWQRVAYTWSLDDDPGMLIAKREAARAARKGNLSARLHLSLLLDKTAETDTDRARALTILRSTAEAGLAYAQFELGQRYEAGDGMDKDMEEAMRWYQKAAAQGDVMAEQRVKRGIQF